ncbi:MAG: AEC family transporter, partial [Enterococcus sp.]|nr:AEC family transporter [Enterococcus sp.]
MIFFQSIQSVLSIIIMIALGYILKGQGWFDESFGKSISSLITRVALPASIFVSVLKNLTKESLFQLSGSLIYPVGAVIISYILAYALVKILKIQPGRRGIFMNAVVNANTIFIGLPLNIALFGEKSLPYFLVYYVTNTVSTWAFGVFLISNDDPTKVKGENKAKLNWKKLLPPPLLGFIVAILFLLIGIPVPGFINATLGYVGSIVTPLSLLYIGIVLHDAGLKSIRFDRDTVVALLGRFV